MTLLLPCFMVIAHFIGDFVCQTEWMALNKSSEFKPLAIHIGVYTASFYAVMWWCLFLATALGVLPTAWALVGLAKYALANGAAHFGVDFCSSRLTRWAKANNKNRLFWITIGADQMVHFVIMFLTAGLLFG